MDILFNFPNGLAFTMQSTAVPAKGDQVNLISIDEANFTTYKDFQKFTEYEYRAFIWEVENVIWTPGPGNSSYVNVVLKRVNLNNLG